MGEANRLPLADSAATTQLQEYSRLRQRVLDLMGQMQELSPSEEHVLGDLRERLESGVFHLLVVGQFKRGKTCLLNALLGVELLPVAVIPLTSIVTILTYGRELKVEVSFLDGRIETVDSERLAEYVTEGGNPKNIKGIQHVVITYPSNYLKDGVRLIDTPGVGSFYSHNTDVAYQYLPKADAALFLLSVEQPASQAELEFLKDVRRYSGKIFFLLNKIDILSESEMGESQNFAATVLTEVLEAPVKVFPVSAKRALEAKLEGSDSGLALSRLPEFTSVLERFLLSEKGVALLFSVTGHMMRLCTQMILEGELELKSITMPLQELQEKITLLERRKGEMRQEKDRLGILLDGEVQRVIDEILDSQLVSFKEGFHSLMSERFDSFFEEHRDLPLKELDSVLAEYTLENVERAYREWVVQLGEQLTRAMNRSCEGLAAKVTDIVESLQAYSSDLFEIPYVRAGNVEKGSTRHALSFRLQQDPVGLEMLASSVTHILPGLVSQRFQKLREMLFRWARKRIFETRKSRMLEAIDMQSGQVRYHFVERLKSAGQAFRREMLRQIDEAMEGITQAIQRGTNRRNRGEDEGAGRQAVLHVKFAKLKEIQEELKTVQENLASP